MVTQILTPANLPTCPSCGHEALEYVGPLLDRGLAIGAQARCRRGHLWAVAWRRHPRRTVPHAEWSRTGGDCA